MPIFKIQGKQLLPIKESKIDLEKDLQKITEENLEAVFGLKFVSSEFQLNNLRIDTLAFDEETNSFIIIEFKRDRSFSVIDQGYAYLALMLNNKADFILEYNENLKANLKRENIDWSQSRVLFLANSFTTYQQNAINFKDLPIELWEVKRYDNETILYNQFRAADTKESIKTVSKSKTIVGVSKEVKAKTVYDHFNDNWVEMKELFEKIREKILDLDNRIIENPNPNNYIGYKIGNANICTIHPYKSKLGFSLGRVDKEDVKDPENWVKKVPWKKFKWPKLCVFDINSEEDIDYAMFLIKQVYDKFYK
ncbi:MAG: hypothetical protein ACOZBH_05260 [Patescibacteria group bacterium]